MRSAGAEPTAGRAFEATIVIGLTAPWTDPLIMRASLATWLKGYENQVAGTAQLPSKRRLYFQVAQMMRARRLARATVATL